MSIDIITYSKLNQLLKKAGFIGTKDVDETGLKDENILYYSKDLDKYITKELKIKVNQWQVGHSYEKNEIVVYDNMMHWVLENHISHPSSIDFDLIESKIIPLASQAGWANILGLEYSVNQSYSEVEFTWTNPTEDSFKAREGFVSNKVDVTLLNYNQCIEKFELGLVEKITQGMGTGTGSSDRATYAIEERNIYNVKIFAIHETGTGEVSSSGRYTKVENPDITPPVATDDLFGVVENGNVSLTWTQPVDSDFLHAKLVRSQTSMPKKPSDGMVLDTISGNVGSFLDTSISKGIMYFYKIFFYDDSGDGFEQNKEGNWSASNGVEIEDSAVYGFNTITKKRTRDAINMQQSDFDSAFPWSSIVRAVANSDGTINYYLNDEDSSLKEDGITASSLDGRDGNVVVEYPEFYYSYVEGEILIGREEFEGSKLSPRVLVGAFEATETLTGELQSVAGIVPLTGKSITEYRLMSSNIGVGWQQKDIEYLDILKYLFLVEYGDLNSQALVGEGVVNTAKEVATGSSITLGNSSGATLDGTISYRGLENPWGNVWEFVEGLVATDIAYYKAIDNFDSFVSDTSIGNYFSTGVTPSTENGFISKLHEGGVMLGKELLGDSVNHVGDYQYSHKEGEVNIAVNGGDFRDGNKAGLFRTHMGLRPFGKEEEMQILHQEADYTVYETDLNENELEKIKNIAIN